MRKYYFFITLFGIFFGPALRAQAPVSCTVYFESNDSAVSAAERVKLKGLFSRADTGLITSVTIFGYCDDRGSSAHNDTLSLSRANSVRTFLVGMGIPPRRITNCRGKGELAIGSVPSADAAALRARNRKAVVTLTYRREQQAGHGPGPLLQKDLKIGDKVVLENILFFGGSSKMRPQSYAALDSLLADLLREKQYTVAIVGHISRGGKSTPEDVPETGTGLPNLSNLRAKVIYEYLVSHGVAQDRLAYRGEGGRYPTGRGDNYDRRVEIEITGINNR
jgi:outer membrane protein OmpA-like peptidoglycan-associated protein